MIGMKKRVGLFIKNGLYLGRGLLARVADGFSNYYQWLPLGEEDDLVNGGTGGTPEVDGNYQSGSMLTQDLIFRQPANDLGSLALSDAYGLGWYPTGDASTPLNITYAMLKGYLTETAQTYSASEDSVNSVLFRDFLKIFNTKPVLVGSEWGYQNENGGVLKSYNIVIYGDSIPNFGYPNLMLDELKSLNGADFSYSIISKGGESSASLNINFHNWVTSEHYRNDADDNIFIFTGLTNGSQSPYDKVTQLYEINDKAQAMGFTTVIMTNTGVNNDQARLDDIQLGNDRLISENGGDADFFIDYTGIPTLYEWIPADTVDGVHPSSTGNRALVDAIKPFLISNVLDITNDVSVIKDQPIAHFNSNSADTGYYITDDYPIIKFKVLIENIGSVLQTIASNYAGTGIQIAIDENDLMVRARNNGVDTRIKTGYVPVNFDDVELRFNPVGFQLYSNGVLQYETSSLVWDIKNYTVSLKLGSNHNALAAYLNNGYLSNFRINDIIEYKFNERSGNIIYNWLSDNYHATLTTGDLTSFRSGINNSEPHELLNDFKEWESNIDQSILITPSHIMSVPDHSIKKDWVDHSGFISSVQNTISFPSINELVDFDNQYGTDYSTQQKSFDLLILDLNKVIPKEDFTINNEGDVIKDMASQPYEQYVDKDGNPVYTLEGKEFNVIKSF